MTLRTGPSLTTLALLGGAVLALHLGLLRGGVSLAPDAPPATQATASPPRTQATPPAVLVTQVRRVVHAPPAAASRTPAAPVQRPKQAAAKPPTEPPAEAIAQTPQRAPAEAPSPAPVEPLPAPTEAAAQPAPPDPPAETAVAHAATPAPEPPAAAAAAQPALPPSDPPPSVNLPYDVTGEVRGYTYHASGTLEWRLDAQGYGARMELSMLFLGSRIQTSRGSVGPDGLRPERFADRRRSERAAHFDREAGNIRFSNNARPAPLLPGAQDRLSLFMQLAGLLRARPHQEGEAITFQVAGVGDAEPWRFEVGPMETLDLPAGAIDARRLTRTPRKAHDSTVEVWLAPSIGHLPVRLRVAQSNGDVADQRLARWP